MQQWFLLSNGVLNTLNGKNSEMKSTCISDNVYLWEIHSMCNFPDGYFLLSKEELGQAEHVKDRTDWINFGEYYELLSHHSRQIHEGFSHTIFRGSSTVQLVDKLTRSLDVNKAFFFAQLSNVKLLSKVFIRAKLTNRKKNSWTLESYFLTISFIRGKTQFWQCYKLSWLTAPLMWTNMRLFLFQSTLPIYMS